MKTVVQRGKIKSSCALGIVLGVFCSVTSFATPFPEPVNGVVTLDVKSGTTTYDSGTLSSQVTSLVKTGDGIAVISVESPNFSGSTEVQEGTLTLKVHQALGPVGSAQTGGAVTVLDKATLHLNWPGIGQADYLWQKRTVAIEGTGADGTGALVIAPTTGTGTMNDRIIGTLELTGNATVTSTQRWGVSVALKFNGNTLTRNGEGAMMLLNKIVGPGDMVLNRGTTGTAISFQPSTSFTGFDAKTSKIICNDKSCVTMYQTASEIPFNFEIKGPDTRVYASNNGTAPNENRNYNVITGDILLPAESELAADKVYTYTQDKSGGNMTYATWRGKVTQRSLMVKSGTGALVIDGEFDGFAVGSADAAKRFQLSNGDLIFGPCAKVRNLNMANYNQGLGGLTIEGGQIHFTTLQPAYGGRSRPKPTRMLGGDVHVRSEFGAASGSNQCSEVCIEGGRFVTSNQFNVAYHNAFSTGFFVQRGGLVQTPVVNKVQSLGNMGYTVYSQSGGTNDSCCTGRGGSRVRVNENGGSALMMLTGSNTLFKTENFEYAYGDSRNSDFNLALTDGATLSLDRFRRATPVGSAGFEHTANVYVNGGILDVRTSNGLSGSDSSEDGFYKRSPDHFVIGPNGFVVETKDCYQNVTTTPWTRYRTYIPFDLEKPTGLGLSEIRLPTTDAFKSLTYYSSARIEIEGDGFGASALADWDFEQACLVVRIANPGCGYSKANTTVKIQSPDLASWYDCDFDLSAQKCGPIVVRGESGAIVYGRSSTFDGGVSVAKGSYLRMATPGSIPNGNALRVDGQFDVHTNDLVVSELAGSGEVIRTGTERGNITLAADGAVRVKASELFAAGSTPLRFPALLTLSTGAKIVVEDPESLPETKDGATVLTANGGLELIGGSLPPLVDAQGRSLSDHWKLRIKNGGKSLCLGPQKGMVLLFR